MTVTPEQVAAVAGKLTRAQRKWLLEPGYIDPNSVRSLRRKGILRERQRGLTDLGNLLRAHLHSTERQT